MQSYPFNPENLLLFMLLGSLFGMVGQAARVLVGYKKSQLTATAEPKPEWELSKVGYSLLIAFAVGAMAGTLAVITDIRVATDGKESFEFSKAAIWIWIGAGYAGTDFIEGLFKKP